MISPCGNVPFKPLVGINRVVSLSIPSVAWHEPPIFTYHNANGAEEEEEEEKEEEEEDPAGDLWAGLNSIQPVK